MLRAIRALIKSIKMGKMEIRNNFTLIRIINIRIKNFKGLITLTRKGRDLMMMEK